MSDLNALSEEQMLAVSGGEDQTPPPTKRPMREAPWEPPPYGFRTLSDHELPDIVGGEHPNPPARTLSMHQTQGGGGGAFDPFVSLKVHIYFDDDEWPPEEDND